MINNIFSNETNKHKRFNIIKKISIVLISLGVFISFTGCNVEVDTASTSETSSALSSNTEENNDNLSASIISLLTSLTSPTPTKYTKCIYIPADGIRSEYSIKDYVINNTNTITITLEDNSSVILSGNYILQ